MVKRKTPLPSPRKILSAVSKKLSPTSDHFYGQEENVSYLLDMFTRTVDKGESNSLLVLGPRGVGKSALVTHVLRSESSSVKCQARGHLSTSVNCCKVNNSH